MSMDRTDERREYFKTGKMVVGEKLVIEYI
jgi:hypothetical protein